MAPEYAMEGIYSTKSDVFGFGVLLIEIITGRCNTGFFHSKRSPSLLAFVSVRNNSNFKLLNEVILDTLIWANIHFAGMESME